LWPEAKAVASAWETAGRCSGDPSAPVPPALVPAPAPESRQTTIKRAVGAFLTEHAESSAPTLRYSADLWSEAETQPGDAADHTEIYKFLHDRKLI